MSRIVCTKRIETHVMQATDVHGQRASELLRFLIERPVDFISQVALNGLAVGRQHAANHAQFRYRAAQFQHGTVDILDRQ